MQSPGLYPQRRLMVAVRNCFTFSVMHQSIPAVPSIPPTSHSLGYCGAFAHLDSPGVGHWQILHCQGVGHLSSPEPPPSFWHARGFLSEYKYTKDFIGKTSRLTHLSKMKKTVEGFKGLVCSQFYACISSLLIKPELHCKIRSYWHDSTFFWSLNQISVDIF